jgi:hypothetical protein
MKPTPSGIFFSLPSSDQKKSAGGLLMPDFCSHRGNPGSWYQKVENDSSANPDCFYAGTILTISMA